MSKEAMRLALEALEKMAQLTGARWALENSYAGHLEAITALKALAEQPAQRTWVGLTDEEAMQICVDCGCLSEDWLTLLDAIEAKLRSKNT